jgi:hypothetical protein
LVETDDFSVVPPDHPHNAPQRRVQEPRFRRLHDRALDVSISRKGSQPEIDCFIEIPPAGEFSNN